MCRVGAEMTGTLKGETQTECDCTYPVGSKPGWKRKRRGGWGEKEERKSAAFAADFTLCVQSDSYFFSLSVRAHLSA